VLKAGFTPLKSSLEEWVSNYKFKNSD